MKYLKYLFLLPLSAFLVFISCNSKSSTSTDTSGNWVLRAECDGDARSESVTFVIGDTAYIGTGYNGEKTKWYDDLWSYSDVTNSWRQDASMADATGKAGGRSSAVAFATSTRGYIATGYDGVNNLQDNWEYNPSNNTWKKKASLPDPPSSDPGSGARYDAVGFAINNIGYIATGYNGAYLKDIWSYNPTTDTWTQLNSYGGTKRKAAVAFVYNNKAYLLTGTNNGTSVHDFWQFDPSSTTPWKQLRDISNTNSSSYDDDYSDIIRSNAVGFVIGNKAYITVGENGSYTKKTWEYDFTTDLWVRKTPYERAARTGAIGFSLHNKGFVGFGLASGQYFDDLDEFKPSMTYDAND